MTAARRNKKVSFLLLLHLLQVTTLVLMFCLSMLLNKNYHPGGHMSQANTNKLIVAISHNIQLVLGKLGRVCLVPSRRLVVVVGGCMLDISD